MPHVAKTWGLRGQTPVLDCRGRHRQKVSAVAALSLSPARRRVGLYLRAWENKAVDAGRCVAFLKHLLRHLRGPVVLVWDNLNTHRSKAVRELARASGRLHLEHLPAYAPELNPVEWFFEQAKCHELANHGLDDLAELHARVRRHARRLARDPDKLRSFIRCAHLPLRL
jgi:putative transposase